MVEMAIGEKTTLEELGGARMHCTVSGCGDVLAASDEEAIELGQALPLVHARLVPRDAGARRTRRPSPSPGAPIEEIVPYDQRKWFDMYEVIDRRDRRGLVVRDQAAVRGGDHRGAGAPRRARGRHRRQPAQGQGRRADGRLLRQGGALHLALQRLQHSARLPGRRRRLHGRHQGRARRGSSATAPRWSSPPRRPRCRRSAWSCASATAPGSTRCAARPSSPTPRSRCRRARSRSWGRSPR